MLALSTAGAHIFRCVLVETGSDQRPVSQTVDLLMDTAEQSQESFNEGVLVPTACLGLLVKHSFICIPHLVPVCISVLYKDPKERGQKTKKGSYTVTKSTNLHSRTRESCV